jgi:hypothetical protein
MKEDKVFLSPPRIFSLEEAISYIAGADSIDHSFVSG